MLLGLKKKTKSWSCAACLPSSWNDGGRSFNIKNFADADKKLAKRLGSRGAFDESFSTSVDISKVNIEVMTRWVSERITELLGFEDDVIINLIGNLLERKTDAYSGQVKKLDPKELQVQLTGFLGKQAGPFTADLWKLLIDANTSPHGIPKAFVEQKKKQLSKDRDAKRGHREEGRKLKAPKEEEDSVAERTTKKILEAQRSGRRVALVLPTVLPGEKD